MWRHGQWRGRVTGRETVRRVMFTGRVRVVAAHGGGGRRAERRRRIRTLQQRKRGRRVGGVRAQVLEQLVGSAEPLAAIRRQVGAHPRTHVRQLAGGRGQSGQLGVSVRRGHRVVLVLLLVLVVSGRLLVMVVSGRGGGGCGGHRLRAGVALRATGRARDRRLWRLFAGGQVSGQLATRAVRVAARQWRCPRARSEVGAHEWRAAQRRHVVMVMWVRRQLRVVVRRRVTCGCHQSGHRGGRRRMFVVRLFAVFSTGRGRVLCRRLAARSALFAAAPVTAATDGHGRRSPYGRVQADRRGVGSGGGGGGGGCSCGHFGGRPQNARFVRFETRTGRGGDGGDRGWLQVIVDDRRAAGRRTAVRTRRRR